MPRVKLNCVVSFSSEDKDHPASNLLTDEVSKKKWLCQKGESSCSVVLQFSHSVQISTITIGAHDAALVEVLVGRSENIHEFEVLVPSCIFLSPSESRRGEGLDRVRTFTNEQLATGVKDKKWDRVRVVCSQPYNRHISYGLSFVHISETEAVPSEAGPVLRQARLPSLNDRSSDDEQYKPGDLFAKYLLKKKADEAVGRPSAATDARIRRASSQALKNIPETATRLVKTPISNKHKGENDKDETKHSDDRSNRRDRDKIIYEDDDEKPNEKIDRVVKRHQEESSNEETKKREQGSAKSKSKKRSRHSSQEYTKKDDSFNKEMDSSREDVRKRDSTPKAESRKRDRDRSRDKDLNASKREKKNKDDVKDKRDVERKKSADDDSRLRAGPISSAPHTLLSKVVFTISGYENPCRADVRSKALAMGAKYERDWSPACTHLICAFPNTPKLKTVRALPNGASIAIVTAEWVEECCARRRLMPWEWFATEPSRKVPQSSDWETKAQRSESPPPPHRNEEADSEMDTDDEIERVINKQKVDSEKKAKHEQSSESRKSSRKNGPNSSSESKKINVNGNEAKSDSGGDTDIDLESPRRLDFNKNAMLPDFFDGFVFLVDVSSEHDGFDLNMLNRYIRAYGGEVVQPHHVEDTTEVNYIICSNKCVEAVPKVMGAQLVTPQWVWRCHEKLRKCSTTKYLIEV